MRQLHAELVDVEGQLRFGSAAPCILKGAAAVAAALGAALAAGSCDGDTGTASSEPSRLVTRDEYAQAVADAVRCIEAEGLTASASEQSDGSFAIQVGSPEEGAGDHIDEVYDECTSLHLNDVQAAYLASIHPNEYEAIEITRRCLVDAGFVDSSASLEEADAVLRENLDDPVVAECRSRPYQQPAATTGE